MAVCSRLVASLHNRNYLRLPIRRNGTCVPRRSRPSRLHPGDRPLIRESRRSKAVLAVMSYALYRECAGQVDVEYEKCLIAGAFPIQPLGLSRPTLAARLLYRDCIAPCVWAVPVGMAQRASATHRYAIAESVAAQSS